MTKRRGWRRVLPFVVAAAITNGPLAAQTAATPAPHSSAVMRAPDQHRYALASQIIDIAMPSETREAMFLAVAEQMAMQAQQAALRKIPDIDAGARAIFDQWLAENLERQKVVLRSHLPRIMDAYARSYANIFTVEELTDILAFARTPSGARFLQMSPTVIAEPHFAAANQAYMNDIIAGLPAAQEELRVRLQEYQARTSRAVPRS